jgi:hypothetical protein
MLCECFSVMVQCRRNVLGFEVGMLAENVVDAHPPATMRSTVTGEVKFPDTGMTE